MSDPPVEISFSKTIAYQGIYDALYPYVMNDDPQGFIQTLDEKMKYWGCSESEISNIINFHNTYRESFLSVAVKLNSKKILDELLKARYKVVDVPSETGLLSIDVAKLYGRNEIVKKLMDVPVTEIDRDYIKKCETIKKAGHILGVDTSFPVKRGDLTFIVPATGWCSHDSIRLLEQELAHYLKHEPNERNEIENNNFMEIHEAFKFQAAYLQYDGSISEEEIIKRYNEGKITVLTVSAKVGAESAHDYTVILYKNNLILANRGAGSVGTGLRIYPLDKTNITKELVKSLRGGDLDTLDNTMNKIGNIVDFHDPDRIEIDCSDQKYGTCSFVNAKAAIKAILFLKAKERGKDNDESQEIARKAYKHFTKYIRDSEINALIAESNWEILSEYVKRHFGKPYRKKYKAVALDYTNAFYAEHGLYPEPSEYFELSPFSSYTGAQKKIFAEKHLKVEAIPLQLTDFYGKMKKQMRSQRKIKDELDRAVHVLSHMNDFYKRKELICGILGSNDYTYEDVYNFFKEIILSKDPRLKSMITKDILDDWSKQTISQPILNEINLYRLSLGVSSNEIFDALKDKKNIKEIIERIKKNGLENREDASALFTAIKNNEPELIRTLLEQGININSWNPDDNSTIFQYLCKYCDLNIIKEFIGNSDLLALDIKGVSALGYAATSMRDDSKEIVEFVYKKSLEKGLNIGDQLNQFFSFDRINDRGFELLLEKGNIVEFANDATFWNRIDHFNLSEKEIKIAFDRLSKHYTLNKINEIRNNLASLAREPNRNVILDLLRLEEVKCRHQALPDFKIKSHYNSGITFSYAHKYPKDIRKNQIQLLEHFEKAIIKIDSKEDLKSFEKNIEAAKKLYGALHYIAWQLANEWRWTSTESRLEQAILIRKQEIEELFVKMNQPLHIRDCVEQFSKEIKIINITTGNEVLKDINKWKESVNTKEQGEDVWNTIKTRHAKNK